MRRKLSKVGGSVMLPVPPEMLEELALQAGSEVKLTSEGGRIRVEPAARPSAEVVEFMRRFMGRCDQALSTLGYGLTATNEQLEDFAVSVATGSLTLEEISRWF